MKDPDKDPFPPKTKPTVREKLKTTLDNMSMNHPHISTTLNMLAALLIYDLIKSAVKKSPSD